MSLGLLGAYCSSGEESEGEEGDTETQTEAEAEGDHKVFNPFIASDDSSSEETEPEHITSQETQSKPRESISNPFSGGALAGLSDSRWLPKPSFMQETEKISGVKYDNSVFSNPFRAREDKKVAILEHHVGVTSRPEAASMFNGKKVCYNFRKGRCRHGHRCKFAHDNDVRKEVSDSLYSAKYDEAAQISHEKVETDTRPHLQLAPTTENVDLLVPPEFEPEDAVISSGKKKRPGLSDKLVPSKKAMKFHNKVYSK